MESLRKQYKCSFNKLVNSNEFKLVLEKYRLTDYKCSILNENHRNEALAILTAQFTAATSHPDITCVALDINAGDFDWSEDVDDAIKNGISFVFLDKYDKVCFVGIRKNITKVNFAGELPKEPKMREVTRILQELGKQDKWHKRVIFENPNQLKVGEVFCEYLFATRVDLIGNKLYVLAFGTTLSIPIDMKCAQYVFADFMNKATIHAIGVLNTYMNNIMQNTKSYVETSSLNIYNYFMDQFKNNEEFKNNFSKTKVFSKLNPKSKIVCACLKVGELRKDGYKMIPVFSKLMDFWFMQARTKKTRSRL